jgi:hypothetical protein
MVRRREKDLMQRFRFRCPHQIEDLATWLVDRADDRAALVGQVVEGRHDIERLKAVQTSSRFVCTRARESC